MPNLIIPGNASTAIEVAGLIMLAESPPAMLEPMLGNTPFMRAIILGAAYYAYLDYVVPWWWNSSS